jgi:hypothetical protein
MKKIFYLILTLLFTVDYSDAQECAVYIPNVIGTELHYEVKNQQGRIWDIYTQKLLSIKDKGEETIYSMLQTSISPKSGKIFSQDTITFCFKGNRFYIDMEQYMSTSLAKLIKNEEGKITIDDLNYPANLSPGQELKGGSITAFFEGAIMNFNFIINIINRKVEAKENMTTPAGSFMCYKLSEDIQEKDPLNDYTKHNVMWISKGIGTIRIESYKEDGTLSEITQLVKVVK